MRNRFDLAETVRLVERNRIAALARSEPKIIVLCKNARNSRNPRRSSPRCKTFANRFGRARYLGREGSYAASMTPAPCNGSGIARY
jgi:hypothetical protein